jgi:hypothetical protein
MRKSNIITAILSAASLVWVAPAHAETEQTADASRLILDYHLPEVRIGFAVSHVITGCPNGAGLDGFAMDTVTAIKPIYGQGEQIFINPKGNLFVDRQVKLEFYENGTLKSFNGSSTGQGGKIVAAAIKAASFAATLAAGVPVVALVAPIGVRCKDKIVQLLQQKDGMEAQLAILKQALLSQGASENLLFQITRTEAALADTLSRLTVSPDPVIWAPTASQDLPSDPVPADLSVWFEPDSRINLTQAFADFGLGQVLAFKAKVTFVTKQVEKTEDEEAKLKEQRSLVYREPGVVKVTLEPRNAFLPGELTGVEEARARAAYEGTKAKATVKVPQIGKLKIIPFNGSGIFGSRAVAATFDQVGELASIGFTSTGGADALAGVVDASVTAGIEQRDQRLNATTRAATLGTQTKLLEDQIEAKANKEAEEAAAAVGG